MLLARHTQIAHANHFSIFLPSARCPVLIPTPSYGGNSQKSNKSKFAAVLWNREFKNSFMAHHWSIRISFFCFAYYECRMYAMPKLRAYISSPVNKDSQRTHQPNTLQRVFGFRRTKEKIIKKIDSEKLAESSLFALYAHWQTWQWPKQRNNDPRHE